ncbi:MULTISPECIES: exodeoxyribonuclease V subunit gamma [unclassified Francisella]|uniref:exodeoxyribonuclease V subunit gamma n=1 Tax=unclassified Francisella TaxID=2610885 RepID=UPI002E30DEF9|nr:MULTISPECIES: exodeoxyribonuclease V subunit gamma [unclassified Francisella]MED7818347.1 exodeoxyribonuclease V subunit gamma [Francisella sp. 19S2-4]MED7829183.1 exodeoxyribonuclease V subunit gamma [Francisella sp. 19S2-10]
MSLYTYPSNKLEYLVRVLSKLLDLEKKDLFTPTQLIVGSRGMQHWLSMQLAETRDIAMNLKYDMINGYILDICYELTNNHEYKKAYTKDILAWRIFKHLDSIDNDKLKEYYKNSDLKKYQLSAKVAEVFSKYLAYRTDWLEAWEQNKFINPTKEEIDELWQMQLWQRLVAEVPATPYKIQAQALELLSKESLKNINVPNSIYIFGINSISKKNLNFIFALAKYIDVNILYINPCSEYWYDLKKDKVSAWLDNDDYEIQPLLANLGQQGKEFFNELLDNEEKSELEVFERFDKGHLNFAKLEDNNQSQLVSLQRNLLELNCQNYAQQKDISISINSCHSPLREVQVLHDRLLDMIKDNPDIKPRDILVMCPNIEDYSPYIDSVFSRYAEDKKLPCSIADRTLLDSEPLAASFIELLQLPESDFEVNKILDYLSVPAIQHKFKISNEQLETIRYWLKEACIHHSNSGETFSWSWGLKRLMLGFSYSDENYIVNDSLMTVPIIEGSEVAELGGLYELLELLAAYSEELLETRGLEDWHSYLLEMFDNVFDITQEEQYIAKKIKDIIARTVETAKEISADILIDLYTIRYCLISQLSEPIINNHFLNGKVTFCSMTPMRSIPFKVVAMLGLNNGKFPRQESAISFDLMARLGRRACDRTKRDDDRYLFLEAILSARDYLYFSYLGRSVKTNVEQQPSLVLKELISYLRTNYSWQYEDIKEYPLHAFSPKCYADNYRSYDEAWLKLLQAESKHFYDFKKTTPSCLRNPPLHEAKGNANNSVIPSGLTTESINNEHSYTRAHSTPLSDLVQDDCCSKLPQSLTISKLAKVFENPLKVYANYSLDLYLEDNFEELEDSEPFDIDSLDKHKFKQDLLNTLVNEKDKELTIKPAKLSGKLPESVLTEDEINNEVENIQKLLDKANLANYESKYFHQEILRYELEANCYIKDNQVLLHTISTFSIKYKFELYLTALLVALSEQQDISATYVYFDKDKNQADDITFAISHLGAKELLEKYLINAQTIVSKPSLVHLDLAKAIMEYVKESKKKEANLVRKTTKQKQQAWDGVIKSSETNYKALENNSYFKLFYNEQPKIEDFEGEEIYRDFFEVLNRELIWV